MSEDFEDSKWKICPRCGLSTAENHNFCAQCGIPVIEVKCECGKSLNGEDKFCPACGTEVVEVIRKNCSAAMGIK
jgi:uncharacterized membrane protein YvbJ